LKVILVRFFCCTTFKQPYSYLTHNTGHYFAQMSATMDSLLFCSFFQNAPMVSVPGRTFPVLNYYLEDLMDATDHIVEEGSRYAKRENRYEEKTSLWVTSRGGEKRKEVVDLVSQVDLGELTMYPGYKMSTRRYVLG
jgi:HrpA-like RNA helicase